MNSIDAIVERDRARDVDRYWADGPEPETQMLSDFIGGMRLRDFQMDAGDLLLGYMDMSMSELQEALADAQDEAENWPGEHSEHFKARAAQIVTAMLASARNFREIVG
jgi:hypothetical protein